ncbi:UPF0149 family protein [Pseudomonas synxantha]|uniref:UPF0149 family protein n=1 Tax=Pseudomonas synxantha TaxID=47883 RepID=UPI0013DE3B3C
MLSSLWYPALWKKSCDAGRDSQAEFERCCQLLVSHMNSIVTTLMEHPETLHAMRESRGIEGSLVNIGDDWCFGYIRGVALGGGWINLPPTLKPQLRAIYMVGKITTGHWLE